VSTRRRQREIPPSLWTDPGLLGAPKPARLTGMGLWGFVDDEGRAELRADLIAGAVYPGDPEMTPEVIEEHIVQLDESGFLRIFDAEGTTWIALSRPLRTPRPLASECPPPPVQEASGRFLAVGGARARERVREEQEGRTSEWARWAQEQESGGTRTPKRPLLLDAPPIGCPDHPNGRFADCGPCGTARRRHDRWVAQQRYTEQIAEQPADPEPDWATTEKPW